MKKKLGSCFEDSANFMMGLPIDNNKHRLCHGWVWNSKLKKFMVHGWVEELIHMNYSHEAKGKFWPDGTLAEFDILMCYDHFDKFMTGRNWVWYYEVGKINRENVLRYTRAGTSNMLYSTEHFGPWELSEHYDHEKT